MVKANFLASLSVLLLASTMALAEGESRSERGVFNVGEHAEIRAFESFELTYQNDGIYSNQSGSITDRDGATGSTYEGQDEFTVVFNTDVSVTIEADQPYYYLEALLNPSLASEKERVDGVLDKLEFDGVATTTLGYSSAVDESVDSADSKDLILSSKVQLGDVDDQKAGTYQRVYTVTVSTSEI